jgi:hypothetical protein
MLAAAAWLRSTVIHGSGVNTASVSRVSRVRSGSSMVVASSFQVPPAGTTSGGVTMVRTVRPAAVTAPIGSSTPRRRVVSGPW